MGGLAGGHGHRKPGERNDRRHPRDLGPERSGVAVSAERAPRVGAESLDRGGRGNRRARRETGTAHSPAPEGSALRRGEQPGHHDRREHPAGEASLWHEGCGDHPGDGCSPRDDRRRTARPVLDPFTPLDPGVFRTRHVRSSKICVSENAGPGDIRSHKFLGARGFEVCVSEYARPGDIRSHKFWGRGAGAVIGG